MTNRKKVSLVGILSLGAIGVLMTTSLFAAQADTPPLAVTCAGTPSNNTIAWTASTTGGNSPYAYLWSGAEIAGNTSNTVTGTYTASGTYDAMIQVTDASSTMASSTCSATLDLTSPSSTTPTSTPSADIAIAKTVDNANPMASGTVNYMLTVSALGPDTSTDVIATDLLPIGLTFENATTSVGSYTSSTGQWIIGDMMPNSTATLGIAAMVNAGTEDQTLTNTATVNESSTETDPNLANNMASTTITIQAMPTSTPTSTVSDAGLSIMQTVDNTNPATDTMVNYTLTVSALGPDTSTAAMATDLLPSGLTFENATASIGSYASSTGMWAIGDMMPNSMATLTIEALVNPGTEGNVITNSATVGEASSVTNTSDAVSSAATLTVQAAATGTSGGGSGGGSTTPTSTSPTITIPPTLTIGADGSFLARGMTVMSVASGSFQAEIWGITYTINWNGKLPHFFFRNGNNDTNWVPSAQLNIGDVVGVQGTVSSTNPLVVTTDTVRDYSIMSPRPSRGDNNGNGFRNSYDRR